VFQRILSLGACANFEKSFRGLACFLQAAPYAQALAGTTKVGELLVGFEFCGRHIETPRKLEQPRAGPVDRESYLRGGRADLID
jgi:hypothetical protein